MAENKMEAVLSFKLDDRGLKDAEKELQTLEKQLDQLNKQQAGASSENEGRGPTKKSAAALQSQIDETQARLKLSRLQQGDPELSRQLTQSIQGRVGERDPKKMLAKTLEDVIGKALNEVIGGLKDAAKDPAIGQLRDKMKRTGARAMGGKPGPVSPGDAPVRESEADEETVLESTFGPGETRNQKLRRLQREKKRRDQKKAEAREQAAADAQAASGGGDEAEAPASPAQKRRRNRGPRSGPVNRDTDRFVSDQPLGPYDDFAPEPDSIRGEVDHRPYITRQRRTRTRSGSEYLTRRDKAALDTLATQDQAATDFEERVEAASDEGEARAERARRDRREGGAYRPNQQKYRPKGSVNLPISSTARRRTGPITSQYQVRTPEQVRLSQNFLTSQPELNVFEQLPPGANPAGAVTPAPRLSDAAADLFVEPQPVEAPAPPPEPPDESWKAKYRYGAAGPQRVKPKAGPEHYEPPAPPPLPTSLPVAPAGPSMNLSGLFATLSQGLRPGNRPATYVPGVDYEAEQVPYQASISPDASTLRVPPNIATNVDALPPLKPDHNRVVHVSRTLEGAAGIINSGLNYAKQGMASSTSIPFATAEEAAAHVNSIKGDPRFSGPAIFMDVPQSESRVHEAVGRAPGRISNKYIVGATPTGVSKAAPLPFEVAQDPLALPATTPTGAIDFSGVKLPSDKLFERPAPLAPTTPPPPKEEYIPSRKHIAGPEEFLVDPAAPKPKLSAEDKAKSKEASRFVTDTLKEREKVDKETAKYEEKHNAAIAKEIEAKKEVYKKEELATKASKDYTEHLAKGRPRDPGDIKTSADLAGEAYKAHKAAFTEADKRGDTVGAKIASDAMAELTTSIKAQKDAYVGNIKETNSFGEHLSAISKKATLEQHQADLMERFKAEPDKAQRKEFAQQLNVTNKRLQEYITDPGEKRALTKENNARNKEYGINADMMGSFGQFLAGNVLLQSAQMMRKPYTSTNQAFDAFNQQHQVDPVLLSSQRANMAAELGVGEKFQGYNLFKNSVANAAITNPVAPAAAVIGDVGGAIAGPAGSMLQTGASLNMAATDNKALKTLLSVGSGAGVLGLAGLAGAGVGLGLGALLTNTGPQKKDPFETLRTYFDPKGVAGDKTLERYGGQLSTMTGPKLQQVQSAVASAGSAVDEFDKADKAVGNIELAKRLKRAPFANQDATSRALTQSVDTSDETTAKAGKAREDSLKKLGDLAEKISKLTDGKGLSDEVKNSPDLLKGFIDTFQKSLFQGGSDAVKKFQQIIDNDPVFKLQQKQMREQRADQQVDFARSRQQLDLSFARQNEDINKGRTRTKEDFTTSSQRLGVSRTRAAEDNTLANRQNDLGISRTRRDVDIQMQRLDEDLTKQRFRLAQDDSKARLRLEEDTTKQTVRLHEDVERSYKRTADAISLQLARTEQDVAKSWGRAVEDATRTAVRTTEDAQKTMTRAFQDAQKTMTRAFEDGQLTRSRLIEDTNTSRGRLLEDAGTSRSRLAEDYNTTVKNQNRNYARSNQDLDQGYQDSVIGIVAPGLASNPAYNLMKLTRDYNKNKSRLGEDYTTNRDELNKNTDRSFADIAKNVERGMADIQKSFDRTIQDVAKSYQRTSEDVNMSLARTAEDVNTTLARTTEDINTQLSRLSDDISTTLSRAMEDAAKSLQIATEDANTALTRGLDDINQNLTRSMDDLNQNFIRATQDMQVEEFRARFDAQKSLMDAEIDYQTNRNKIQLDYNRTVEDLNNAEFDLKRDYNRQLTDFNTAQDRAKQDYEFASNGLNLSIQRADRDFENASSSFVMSVAQAAGLIGSYNQQIANNAVHPPAGGGNGSVSASNNPNNSVPGLNGFDDIPKDGFPAVLHQGEMVITRGESETLRKAGYRPESKNLSEIIPALLGVMPKFASGNNGGYDYEAAYRSVMPDGHGGDSAHPNKMSYDEGRKLSDELWARYPNGWEMNPQGTGYQPSTTRQTPQFLDFNGQHLFVGSKPEPIDPIDRSPNVAPIQVPAGPWNSYLPGIGGDIGTGAKGGPTPGENGGGIAIGMGLKRLSVSEALHGANPDSNKIFKDFLTSLPRYAGGSNGGSDYEAAYRSVMPEQYIGFHRNLAGAVPGTNYYIVPDDSPNELPYGSVPPGYTAIRASDPRAHPGSRYGGTNYDPGDPHGGNDFTDPSLRNPTFANSQTPGYGPTGPNWYGLGGFNTRDDFYAANPEWVPGTGSKWKEAEANRVRGVMTSGDAVIDSFKTGLKSFDNVKLDPSSPNYQALVGVYAQMKNNALGQLDNYLGDKGINRSQFMNYTDLTATANHPLMSGDGYYNHPNGYDYTNDPHGNGNYNGGGSNGDGNGWFGFGGFDSEAAFYAANPEWVPGTGSKWKQDQINRNKVGKTYQYLGNTDLGTTYRTNPSRPATPAETAEYLAGHPATGGSAGSGAKSSASGSYSTSSGIGTPGLLTNSSTRGIISATSDFTPPASSMSAGGSFSSRAGNITVSVTFSGQADSRLQQIINQSTNAFARNLSAQKLQIS